MRIKRKTGTQYKIEDNDNEMSVTEAIKESEGDDDELLHELLSDWLYEEMYPDDEILSVRYSWK